MLMVSIFQSNKKYMISQFFSVLSYIGNGSIDHDELRTVLVSCVAESKLKFSDEKIDELTE